MSDHVTSYESAIKLLPRLVARSDRSTSKLTTDPAVDPIESEGALDDGRDRNAGAACAQALSPALPAGFNPYFDLPPV